MFDSLKAERDAVFGLDWTEQKILTEPAFDGLRGTPEFEVLVEEIQQRIGATRAK